MYIWTEIGLKFLKNEGVTPPPGASEQFVKMSLVQAAEYYIKNYAPEKTVMDVVKSINDLVEDFYFNEVVLKDGVLEFLKYLKNKGVKMCIATATDKYMVEKALERNGIRDFFSEIFTCTSVGAGKDTSVIYDRALEHLSTDKNTTFVFEDALYAIETAKNADYKIVGIYDVSEAAEPKKLKELCDVYINDYSEIYKYF
jgi:HAD superfamily hydrolase (TIGR01509 family)